MQDVTRIGFTNVQIDTVGTYVVYQGETYVITRTLTSQDTPGQFTTLVTLRAVDDNGDVVPAPPITVNTDMHDIRVK